MSREEVTGSFADSFWCLYLKTTKTLIDGLSWRQLRAIIATIKKDDQDQWLVWREGEPEWSRLPDRLESLLDTPVKHRVSPPAVPGPSRQTTPKPGLSTNRRSFESFDRRMSKRFPVTVEVVVNIPGKPPFQTKTSDISILGMKLSDDLPFERADSFILTLQLPTGPLDLICQMNKTDSGYSKARLKILPNKNIQMLADYLTSVN